MNKNGKIRIEHLQLAFIDHQQPLLCFLKENGAPVKGTYDLSCDKSYKWTHIDDFTGIIITWELIDE